MFFRDSIKHERGQKFEEWQQTTGEALQRPGVRQQLGQLGVRLIELNQNAFLPNVRHAEVSVPRRYLDTNHIGVLPYLASDHDLKPHDTLLQPTPTRRERIRELLGQQGLDNSDHALGAFIRRSVAQIAEDESAAFVNPRRNVSGGAPSHHDEATGILVASRPLVVPKWQEIPRHQALRTAVGAHELVHAVDVEELMGEPDVFYRARTELRGYRVGAVVAEDAIASGELTRWRYEHDDNITVEMEEIRQSYGIDSDILLNGDPRNEQVGEAALFMGMMGYVEL